MLKVGKKQFRSIVKEAMGTLPDQKEFRRIASMLHLPKDGRFTPGNNIAPASYTWERRGGYAGEKTVERVKNAAASAGWTSSPRSSASPDGGMIGRGAALYSPEGHEMRVSSSYGTTKANNSFSISIRFARGPVGEALIRALVAEVKMVNEAYDAYGSWRAKVDAALVRLSGVDIGGWGIGESSLREQFRQGTDPEVVAQMIVEDNQE